ncbi:MAG: hypothetical protein AAFN92_14715, partial [Bacteroidota bacterium]
MAPPVNSPWPRPAFLLFLLCLLLSLVARAQDVENIAKADPVVLTGGLRLGGQFYNVSGISQRRPE